MTDRRPARLPVAAPGTSPAPPAVRRAPRRVPARRATASPTRRRRLLARALDMLAGETRRGAPGRTARPAGRDRRRPACRGRRRRRRAPGGRRRSRPDDTRRGTRARDLARRGRSPQPRARARPPTGAHPAAVAVAHRGSLGAQRDRRHDSTRRRIARGFRGPVGRARDARLRVRRAPGRGGPRASGCRPALARHAAVALALVTETLATERELADVARGRDGAPDVRLDRRPRAADAADRPVRLSRPHPRWRVDDADGRARVPGARAHDRRLDGGAGRRPARAVAPRIRDARPRLGAVLRRRGAAMPSRPASCRSRWIAASGCT